MGEQQPRRPMDPRMIEALINAYPQIKDQMRRDFADEFLTSEVAKQGWPKILINLRQGEKPDQRLIDAWNHHLRREDWLAKRMMYWLQWGGLLEKEFDAEGKVIRVRWKPAVSPKEVEADGIARFWEREYDDEEDETRHALFDLVPFKGDPIVASIMRQASGESTGNVQEVKGVEKEWLDMIKGRSPVSGRIVPQRDNRPALSAQRALPLLERGHPTPPEESSMASTRRSSSNRTQKTIPFRERKTGEQHRKTQKKVKKSKGEETGEG